MFVVKCVSKPYIASASSFSVGLRFYYWEFYKDLKELPFEEQMIVGSMDNSNDHSGYDICDLFIIGKYASFKEEIMAYKYLTLEQYQKCVFKVNQYINAKIVKAMKAPPVRDAPPYMKGYGISVGAPLLFSHLLSLVIYCDNSELCTDFSGSFRAIHRFETLGSIKQRNSEYYWFSKFLRETVECYGQCSWEEENKLLGPYYCGMSIVLNMPAFNIRLCAPTSTSVHIEVAMKFSTDQGMIIQFNNPEYTAQYRYLRGFNVSWISKYSEEAERYVFNFVFAALV